MKKKQNKLAIFGLFFVVLTMTATLLAIFFLQKPVSESDFDTRKAAMVDAGLVEINTYPFDQSTLKVKEKQEINLQINSKDKALDYIELKFEIIADQGLLDRNKIQFVGDIPETLEVNKEEIVESTCDKDCYLATLILTSKDTNNAYTTNDQMQTISKLEFNPQAEGNLELRISQESQVFENGTTEDILQKPQLLTFEYFVTENGIDPAQCSFVYSDWSSCENNWQTRTFDVEPDNCHWYENEDLKELSQSCSSAVGGIVQATGNDFYLYSKENCWNYPSDGSSLYIIWDKNEFKNVTWIDVSESPSFDNFYHKRVDGNIDQEQDEFIMVNANGFTNAQNNKGPLSFEPDKQYFFRIYSTDNGGYHVSAKRFYNTFCSGVDNLYYNCNDLCGEKSDTPSRECAPGLVCHEDRCRNEDNPSSEICLATPGISTQDSQCNEYCANSSECATGLQCWWNHCRDPKALESSSCEVPNDTVYTNHSSYDSTKSVGGVLLPSEAYELNTYSCNHGCDDNRDCDANLRCYKGTCRLADNPESNTCSIFTETKGGDTEASATGVIVAEEVDPSPTEEAREIEEKSPFTSGFNNKIFSFMSSFSWQWLAIAGVVLVVAIALIIVGIAKGKKDPWEEIKTFDQEAPKPTEKKEEKIEIPENKPTQLQ